MSHLPLGSYHAWLLEEDTIYLLHNDKLYTLHLPNPTRIPRMSLAHLECLVAGWQHDLLVQLSKERLVMLNLSTGTVRWTRKCDGHVSAWQGRCTMSHKDGIYVLDWQTGKTLHKFGHPDTPIVMTAEQGVFARANGTHTYYDYDTKEKHSVPSIYWLAPSRTHLIGYGMPNLAPWPPFMPILSCRPPEPRFFTTQSDCVTEDAGEQRRFQHNVGLLRTVLLPDILTLLLQL